MDDQHKHEGEYHFRHKASQERIASGRMKTITIRRESAAQLKTVLAAGDYVQDGTGENSAQNLGDQVGDELRPRKSFAHDKAHGNRWI